MIKKKFPLASGNQGLVKKDFLRFSKAFADILLEKVVTAEHLDFIVGEKQLKDQFSDESCLNELVGIFRQVVEDGRRIGKVDNFLFLPFVLSDQSVITALFSGLDPLFLRRVTEDWLFDVRREAKRSFLLLKQARIDDLTGLFNLSNLYSLLDTFSSARNIQLLVVEIPGKSMTFQAASRHLHRCVETLRAFVPERAILHHLGNSIFAVVTNRDHKAGNTGLAASLVAYLKREGFKKVHIGTTCSTTGDIEGKKGKNFLDEAWTALWVARKRGPYGFCDFDLLAHPEAHPLVRPHEGLLRKLRRLWRQSERFFLIYFRSDEKCFSIVSDMKVLIDRGECIPVDNDLLVFLDGENDVKVLQWTENVLESYRKIKKGNTVSAGICGFPYADFKKGEIPYNCLKALEHSSFYGDCSATLFNAVSLNISGDIFFGDGDLVQAVKEYKRGLLCDAENVNLYNSLGVTYALMNRHKQAEECFKKGLELDADNFMALYNLGLGELEKGRREEAITFFRQALGCGIDETLDQSVREDLCIQIGVLSSETGNYQEGLDFLLPLYESFSGSGRADRIVYHIGLCHYGLGSASEAMMWLQKALRIDEFDHRALNLLGKVYFENGEGAEVALSLCRKSVELRPDLLGYRIVLARIQIHCGLFQEAKEVLKPCLKDKRFLVETRILLAGCCLEIGHERRALNWFNKIAEQEGKQFEEYVVLSRNLLGKRLDPQ
ncbi:tetratricopeptide repeat protein [Desulfomarina sp.]